MAAPTARYFVLWKGRQTGPFTLAELRSQLQAGEISRMHQVGQGESWQTLDDFLDQQPEAVEGRRVAEAARREELLRQRYESPTSIDRSLLHDSSGPSSSWGQSPLSHLIPRSPEQAATTVVEKLPHEDLEPSPWTPLPGPSPSPRMNVYAIGALAFSLCNFIPYVNFVSWMLALASGHLALAQMKTDPSLRGRGLALAGLGITYFLLVLVLTFGVLVLTHTGSSSSLLR